MDLHGNGKVLDSQLIGSVSEEGENYEDDSAVVYVAQEHKIYGYHLLPACSSDEQICKRCKLTTLNVLFTDVTFTNKFSECWKTKESICSEDVKLLVDPIRIGILDNILYDTALLGGARQEFNDLEWNKRTLDLYEFFQSKDLANIEHLGCIKAIYDILKSDIMKMVSELTQLELNKVSATCSLYGDTDYLLVHDDQQDDRAVAFILYLTEWNAYKSGGCLKFLSKDDSGEPLSPNTMIGPTNNRMVFFQVSRDSYHMVSEVQNKDECRLSINGWFHSSKQLVLEKSVYRPLSVSGRYDCQKNVDLRYWICTEYLKTSTMQAVQNHIEEHSEIALQAFLKMERFHHILQLLELQEIEWKRAGPPNRRLYEVVDENTLPTGLMDFVTLFKSSEMIALLKSYTDLDITSMHYELQRWEPGCYSLLTGDNNWNEKNELDLILYFGCPTNSIIGGKTMYISTEERIQEALITVEPSDNNLNIIFRDTARITKSARTNSPPSTDCSRSTSPPLFSKQRIFDGKVLWCLQLRVLVARNKQDVFILATNFDRSTQQRIPMSPSHF